MNPTKELSELTDKELLEEAKKMKSSSRKYALLIGCVIGVIIYGVAKKNMGYFALIAFLVVFRRFFSNPDQIKKNEELKRLLKERNLK